ncbi:hypothetical protein ACFSCX_06685 [Bacillus salitolerans]|uniref:Uncharacterized protein n=1 Tax=Bacillus salitolerans TaxID=1437434 RepID=A0ABW4LM36_9BACI
MKKASLSCILFLSICILTFVSYKGVIGKAYAQLTTIIVTIIIHMTRMSTESHLRQEIYMEILDTYRGWIELDVKNIVNKYLSGSPNYGLQ